MLPVNRRRKERVGSFIRDKREKFENRERDENLS